MTKKHGLYLLLAGAAVSIYDMATSGSLYGPGNKLEKAKMQVYKDATGKVWYLSISDAAAIAGAAIYLMK